MLPLRAAGSVSAICSCPLSLATNLSNNHLAQEELHSAFETLTKSNACRNQSGYDYIQIIQNSELTPYKSQVIYYTVFIFLLTKVQLPDGQNPIGYLRQWYKLLW